MRRALRIAAWTVGSVLFIVVALAAAVLIAGNTGRGRLLIEQQLARLTHGHVRLTALSGSFPAALDLEQLQLADERGVWLTANRISLRWSPLRAPRAAREGRECPPGTTRDRAAARERVFSKEPARVRPASTSSDLSIGTLALGPQLAGARASLALQGTAHF